MPEAKRLPRLATSASTGIVRVFASDSERCASALAVSPLILVTRFRYSAKIAVPRQFLIVEIRQWLDPRVCIDILGHFFEVVILISEMCPPTSLNFDSLSLIWAARMWSLRLSMLNVIACRIHLRLTICVT